MKPLPASTLIPDVIDSAITAPGKDAQRRQIRSTDLLGGSREVLIEHSGEFYSLRRTSKGKLILTK
jgi:hemin uptake protein HemP